MSDDDDIEFEVFYCETLEQALAVIPEKHRQRALKKIRVIKETE